MGEHKEAQAVLVSSIAAYCRNRERKTKSAYHSQGPLIQVVLSRRGELQSSCFDEFITRLDQFSDDYIKCKSVDAGGRDVE